MLHIYVPVPGPATCFVAVPHVLHGGGLLQILLNYLPKINIILQSKLDSVHNLRQLSN